jgi:hypothetical protein
LLEFSLRAVTESRRNRTTNSEFLAKPPPSHQDGRNIGFGSFTSSRFLGEGSMVEEAGAMLCRIDATTDTIKNYRFDFRVTPCATLPRIVTREYKKYLATKIIILDVIRVDNYRLCQVLKPIF